MMARWNVYRKLASSRVRVKRVWSGEASDAFDAIDLAEKATGRDCYLCAYRADDDPHGDD